VNNIPEKRRELTNRFFGAIADGVGLLYYFFSLPLLNQFNSFSYEMSTTGDEESACGTSAKLSKSMVEQSHFAQPTLRSTRNTKKKPIMPPTPTPTLLPLPPPQKLMLLIPK